MTHARRGMRAWTVGLGWAVMLGLLIGASPVGAQTLDVERIGQSLGAGARGPGMGGAFTAVVDDATAVSWNPAGATALEKPSVSVGYAPWGRLRADHPSQVVSGWQTGAYQETASTRSFEHASVALPFRLGAARLVALAGYQRAVPMGWGRDYTLPYGLEGESGGLPNSITYTSNEGGGLDVWSAGLGVRLGRAVSLGATLDVWSGDALAKSSQHDEATDSDLWTSDLWTEETVDQSMSGIGARVGLLVTPSPRIRLAAMVRTPVKMDYRRTSTSTFEAPVHSIDEELEKDGSFDWPLAGTLGAAYRPREDLTLAVDVSIARWADVVFDHSYEFVITTRRVGQEDERTELSGQRRQTWPLFGDPDDAEDTVRQSDTMQARLGVEYAIGIREGITLPVRVGGFLDRQLTRDEFGDAVRHTGVTAGIGVRAPYVGFDLAWVYEKGRTAFKDASGDLQETSHRLLLSATLRP